MIAVFTKQFFNDYINDKFKLKPDIKAFLMNHERKEKCLLEVTTQVRIAELSNNRRGMDMHKIRILSEAGARMFCEAALQYAEEGILSSAERQRRVDVAERADKLQDELIDKDVLKPEKKVCK